MLISLAAYYLFTLSREEDANGEQAQPSSTAIALLCALVLLDVVLTVTAFLCTLQPLVSQRPASKPGRDVRIFRAVVLSTLAPLVTTFVSYGSDRV